ncbi:MAG: beta-glycosidase [Tannerellaceae bacterium]|jgi:glucosylceramidase|nr:beta-glycosidase [Tannerellaceae bacterium]
MMKVNKVLVPALALAVMSCSKAPSVIEFVTTTETDAWEMCSTAVSAGRANGKEADIQLDTAKVEQTIEGFGSCFNELGALAFILLDEAQKDSVMRELFSPRLGANFTVCRTPVGANDFAREWYSYNETEGDFDMKNFSIETDREMLLPFIKEALRHNPELRIWASPWSPPSWMKHNKHYASRPQHTQEYDNGLPKEREGFEGTDMFIREDAYLNAYAKYFGKYVDAYRQEGVNIFAIMPQNEFNSAQVFPSCCWTAAGLAEFTGRYLGPAMAERNVEVMFGTMERPNEALVDTVLNDSQAAGFVKGVGFQWAGKDALPGIHKRYPGLRLYQTEQECGDGKNDWAGAVYSWNLMRHYLDNGVSVYLYWNTALPEGAPSHWGWRQNSLVTVSQVGDTEMFAYRYTHEYYVLKHVSHYVMPGARKLALEGEYRNVLAFRNPDNSIVVVAGNEDEGDRVVSTAINNHLYRLPLKGNSLSTIIIR